MVEVPVDFVKRCAGTAEGWRILATSDLTLEEQNHSVHPHESIEVQACSELHGWCWWWPGVLVKRGFVSCFPSAEHLGTLLAQKVAAFPETKKQTKKQAKK